MHSTPALEHLHPACQIPATQAKAPQTPQIKSQGSSDAAIVNAKVEKVKLRPAAKVSGVSDVLARALNNVAREVGVDMEELGDAVQLVDLGVDSLMTLTISGHFREELEVDVESTLFADGLTVGHLKMLLASSDNDTSSQHSSDDDDSSANTGLTTPDADSPPMKPQQVNESDVGSDE